MVKTDRFSKTLIVSMCGFDSVPSDLGTWLLVRAIRDRCVRDILSLNSSAF